MSKRVLIVEDEALVAMDIEAVVIAAGYSVAGPASTEVRALELLAKDSCDIALLDVNLGTGGTIDSVAQILTERNIRFAFVSGYARTGLPEKYRHVPLLSKPFDPAHLAAMLAKLSNS